MIINHSLNHGTQIPYIKKALDLGYDILITNTNDNYRNGKSIPSNGSPHAHANYVFNKYLINANPENVAIVAHSFGGAVTVDLVRILLLHVKLNSFFNNYFKKKKF